MAASVWGRLRANVGAGGIIIGGMILAALAFVLVSAVRDAAPQIVDTSKGSRFTCTVLSVLDGDGPITCSEIDGEGKPVNVRLRGIEAREPDDTCSRADLCPKASGAEAKATLKKLAVGRLECLSFGPSYERVDASCRNPTGEDISCEMIRSGGAVRWPEFDPEGKLRACTGARP